MSIYKVEDVSRPGGESLSKHKGVKVKLDFVTLKSVGVHFGTLSQRLWDPI